MAGRVALRGNSRFYIQMALDRIRFRAGGDIEGTNTNQTVVAVQGALTLPVGQANPGDDVRVDVLDTPRSLVIDGDELWIGESDQTETLEPYVWCLDISQPTQPLALARLDLSREISAITTVRDIAQDANYVYAAGWDGQNVAIIDKATKQVVGWAYAPSGVGFTRVISVCTDGAGKLFANVNLDQAGASTGTVVRWDVAACVGQPPDTVLPEASVAPPNNGRKLRYGAGSLYLTDAGFGGGIFHIDPVGAMAVLGNQPAVSWGMDAVVAFGSLWVTDNATGDVLRLNPATLAVEATIAVPGAGTLDGIGLVADLLWVSDQNVAALWSIDPTTDAASAAIPVAGACEGIAGNATQVFAGAYIGPSQPGTTGLVYVDLLSLAASQIVPVALSYERNGALSGPQAPNGVVEGRTGDTYTNTSGGAGTTFWVKESSPTPDTGWVGK